jgi:hypothetical protein
MSVSIGTDCGTPLNCQELSGIMVSLAFVKGMADDQKTNAAQERN